MRKRAATCAMNTFDPAPNRKQVKLRHAVERADKIKAAWECSMQSKRPLVVADELLGGGVTGEQCV